MVPPGIMNLMNMKSMMGPKRNSIEVCQKSWKLVKAFEM